MFKDVRFSEAQGQHVPEQRPSLPAPKSSGAPSKSGSRAEPSDYELKEKWYYAPGHGWYQGSLAYLCPLDNSLDKQAFARWNACTDKVLRGARKTRPPTD